jgi:hypothetical protein
VLAGDESDDSGRKVDQDDVGKIARVEDATKRRQMIVVCDELSSHHVRRTLGL